MNSILRIASLSALAGVAGMIFSNVCAQSEGGNPAPPKGEALTAHLDCPLKPNCPKEFGSDEKIITMELAYGAAMATFEACKDIHFGGGSVVVTDKYAVPVIALSQPGTRGVDTEVSRRKTYTLLRNGVESPPRPAAPPAAAAAAGTCPTGSRCEAGKDGVLRAVGPSLEFDPLAMQTAPGPDPYLMRFSNGHLIKVNGKIVGAIAATGVPPRDSECSKAGADYIESRLK